ncbi:MAG: TIGR00296 family protein [Promethearchaeota archaeon]
MSELLTLEEGTTLVRLARTTITEFLKRQRLPDLPDTVSGALKEPRSVFVTLKMADQKASRPLSLRGCIGWLQHPPNPNEPQISLLKATQRSAISSAVRDPRFPPVHQNELDAIIIEVSVLTIPEELVVPLRTTLKEHITIGVDGLIVESDHYKGLLLPQVAPEQGWDAEQFLRACCRKAGLPSNKYLDPLVKISKFQAQIFAETYPRGEVVERKF